MFIYLSESPIVSFSFSPVLSGSVVGWYDGAYGSASPIPQMVHLSPGLVGVGQNTSSFLITTSIAPTDDFVNEDYKFDIYVDGSFIATSTRNPLNLYQHQVSVGSMVFSAGSTYRVDFINFRSA